MRIKWYGSRPRQHTKHNDEKSIQTCKNVHHHYCTRALAQKPKLVQLFLETYSTYTQCKCSSREGKNGDFYQYRQKICSLSIGSWFVQIDKMGDTCFSHTGEACVWVLLMIEIWRHYGVSVPSLEHYFLWPHSLRHCTFPPSKTPTRARLNNLWLCVSELVIGCVDFGWDRMLG